MSSSFETRLYHLRKRYGDPILTLLTVLLLLLLFVAAPLQTPGRLVFEIFGTVLVLLMIVGVLVMSGSMIAVLLMSIAFCMNAVAIISRLHKPSVIDLHLVAGAWMMIALTYGFVVARAVFAPGRVTYHRIVGAVLFYLLIGVVFMAAFVIVSLLFPGAISGIALEDSPLLASNLIYFSFVTLTTTGYGDIVPIHPLARSLCNLEAIIGQLYPATLLARLVTLELEGRR
ncbi:potassium channel family protein [Beijerinckia indica]|uniref:Ion transport 2 domain protein n=1 Tax=Beijerinckia indica subsp. indica (strain ATCC 9039 / DSM 1715 / NCIMB 8712) TaxID=395963 RepID=B2IDK0_BEII9|nr:potassium channel family protein [Beijerinckia indica]ACB95436.1 Ion transport 2 domain protein [Beijerinckia indica subsp. indica ATCC 9039]